MVVLDRLDLDEDGVVTWAEFDERLHEAEQVDPKGHSLRVQQIQEDHHKLDFMSKKVR